ncbi:hypothetical protein PENTCL1PPCAC_24616, partial [Pristionchus entomophagus]
HLHGLDSAVVLGGQLLQHEISGLELGRVDQADHGQEVVIFCLSILNSSCCLNCLIFAGMLSRRLFAPIRSAPASARAWQVDEWGGDLRLESNYARPVLTGPNQVLAASVNPIDTYQIKGYGNELLKTWKMVADRSFNPVSRLPYTPGRDCAGIVEAIGPGVTRFAVGDKVMGVTQPPATRGTLADLVVLEADATVGTPAKTTFEEAASLPYVACTVWNAFLVAQLNKGNAKNNRVLIHGGSGGIGTMAIQLLRAWGARKIVVTCSSDSFDTIRSLGAIPIDYRSPTATDELIAAGPYEVVLSCVDSPLSQWSDKIMGIWRNCVHISIVSPMLNDTDRYGLPLGLASTAAKYFARSWESSLQGRWFSYAYFLPNLDCLQEVATLVEQGQIKPMVEKVYSFEQVPEAFEKVGQKHGRGKTIVKMEMTVLPSFTLVDEATPRLWHEWAELVREEQWTSDDNTEGGFLGCVVWNEYEEMAFIGFYLVHPYMVGKGLGSKLWKRAFGRIPPHLNVGLRAVPDMAEKYAAKDTPHFVSSLSKWELTVGETTELCAKAPASASTVRLVSDLSPEQRRELMEFDRRVTNRDRSDLLSLFFEFDRTSGCCLIDGEGKIVGYAGVTSTGFAKENKFKIGPVYASTTSDALTLIRPLADYCESISADSKILVKTLTGTVGEDAFGTLIPKKPSNEGTTLFSKPFTITINTKMCYIPHNNSGHFDA